MIREITATGKNIEDAKETARLILGAGENDNVKYEILDAGSRGILGIINVRPAKVKATMEVPGTPEAQPVREKRDTRRPKREEKIEEIPEMPETEATPRETVIPEAELKMEKLEVNAGEDKSFDFVNMLLQNMGLSATASLYNCEDGTRRIVIEGEEASLLIGHHGDTLDSLQYLANLSAGKRGKKEDKGSRVTIDIEGYRRKREETLRALARRMAAKALRNQKSVMLEPMSAYERRIIHSEVQSIAGVSTNSIGSDKNRKVVIYIVKKPVGEPAVLEDATENA